MAEQTTEQKSIPGHIRVRVAELDGHWTIDFEVDDLSALKARLPELREIVMELGAQSEEQRRVFSERFHKAHCGQEEAPKPTANPGETNLPVSAGS